MNKKIIFIIPLLLIFSVSGCNSQTTTKKEDPTPIEKTVLKLNKTSVSLQEGETDLLTTQVFDTVTWTSSDESVVTVTSLGYITAIKEGKATIFAETIKAKGQCSVTVTAKPIIIPTIHVNDSNPNAIKTTIGSLRGLSASNGKLYQITGIVEQNTYASKGVFDISDDTGYIEVFGAGSDKTCISLSGNNYVYTENYSYGSLNNKIKPGDEVTLEGIFTTYSSYKTTKEFQGYVVSYRSQGKTIPSITYTYDEPAYTGSYYNSTDLSASGKTLYSNLQTLMFNTHNFSAVTYNKLSSLYQYTGEYSGSKYTCFYTGNKVSSMTREHVWCQSLSVGYPGSEEQLWGETGGGCDLLHVRPCTSNVNSTRSNKKFGQLFGKSSSQISTKYDSSIKYTETIWEIPNQIKGDVARILLYTYMHYNSSFNTSGTTRNYTGSLALRCIVASTTDQEALSLLKYWNAIDPVDEVEMNRNNGAYSKQGNRNPFIDHPKLVDALTI